MRSIPPLALAALLAAALLLAPGAAHAAGPKKTTTCKAGQVAVRVPVKAKRTSGKRAAKKTTTRCRALPGVGRAPAATTTAIRKLLPTPAELRAKLPKRLRAKFPLATLKKLDRAVVAKTRGARVRARAAAAQAAGGSCAPGGSNFETSASENGGKVEIAETECLTWESCPRADGTVKGTWKWTFRYVMSATKGDLSATIRSEVSSEADLTAHVGGDARVTTYDVKGAGTGLVRSEARQGGKLVGYYPGATIRVTTAQTGLDPRRGGAAPGKPTLGAWGINGTTTAVLDAQIQLAGFVAARQTHAAGKAAADALIEAEKVWYDQAACLTVDLSPQGKEVTGGEKLPVRVAVKAKDGAEVAAKYDLTPVDGAVGPPTGTTAATVTYTAPNQVPEKAFETFRVVALSNRGRALGTHTAKGAAAKRWFKVTFTGAATYHRYEPRGLPYPQLWSDMELQFTTVMQPARFPGYAGAEQLGYWGSESVALTGTLNGKRLDGGGTGTCAGTPDSTGQIGRLEVRQRGDGYDVAVVPFFVVQDVDDGAQCGTFDDTLVWNDGVQDAMTADVRVAAADLAARDVIEIPVKPSRPIKSCHGGAINGDFDCTHTVDWSGVVRFERTAAPPDAFAD